MTDENQHRPNVYGENHPHEEEEGVDEILEKQREKREHEDGGMGRDETPKETDKPQGGWHQSDECEPPRD